MTPQQLEQVKAERDRLRQEVELQNSKLLGVKERLAGVETILAIITGASTEASNTFTRQTSAAVRARGSVKMTVLDFMKEFAETGLSAADLVEQAKRRGIDLDRGSVSSLLSKLKAEGTLVLINGNRYAPADTRSQSVDTHTFRVSPTRLVVA